MKRILFSLVTVTLLYSCNPLTNTEIVKAKYPTSRVYLFHTNEFLVIDSTIKVVQVNTLDRAHLILEIPK